MGPLLEFLKDMEVGSKESAAEKEKERSGGRKPAGRCIVSAFSLKLGKYKCLKAEHRMIEHDQRDRAKKEK